MKKYLLMALSFVLVAALAIVGTVAYLQNESEVAHNVMTVGNVTIEQLEYERVVDENGDFVKGVAGEDFTPDYGINESYKLQPFSQAKPALPAVYGNGTGTMGWDDFQQLWNQIGAPGSNDLFDPSMANVVDKFVFVKNTGKNDCYFRTIIAIEVPEGLGDSLVHVNLSTNARYLWDGRISEIEAHMGYTYIDGVRYALYEAIHTEPLKSKEISRPSLLQVYLDPKATNEDCAAFGDLWDIYVISQAVQTEGFSDAKSALDAAFGDITVTSNPFTNGAALPAVAVVSTADELTAALAEGGSIILAEDVAGSFVIPADKEVTLNLNGNNITYAGTPVGGNPAVALTNNGTLTIEGNGTISGDYAGFYNVGTAVINGGTFESKDGFGMITDNIYGTETAVTEINGGTFAGIGIYNPTDVTINNCVINVGRDPDGASDHISDEMALFISPTFQYTSAQIATVVLNGGTVNGDVYVYDDGLTTTTFENNGATITGSILTND